MDLESLSVYMCYPKVYHNLSEKLADLSSDGELKFVFRVLQLSNFWFEVRNECPELSYAALNVSLPFASSYDVRNGAFSISLPKSKY